jgi:hypothetical protein
VWVWEGHTHAHSGHAPPTRGQPSHVGVAGRAAVGCVAGADAREVPHDPDALPRQGRQAGLAAVRILAAQGTPCRHAAVIAWGTTHTRQGEGEAWEWRACGSARICSDHYTGGTWGHASQRAGLRTSGLALAAGVAAVAHTLPCQALATLLGWPVVPTVMVGVTGATSTRHRAVRACEP